MSAFQAMDDDLLLVLDLFADRSMDRVMVSFQWSQWVFSPRKRKETGEA